MWPRCYVSPSSFQASRALGKKRKEIRHHAVSARELAQKMRPALCPKQVGLTVSDRERQPGTACRVPLAPVMTWQATVSRPQLCAALSGLAGGGGCVHLGRTCRCYTHSHCSETPLNMRSTGIIESMGAMQIHPLHDRVETIVLLAIPYSPCRSFLMQAPLRCCLQIWRKAPATRPAAALSC